MGSDALEKLMEQIDKQHEKRVEKSQFYEKGYRDYVGRLEEAKRQISK